MADANDMELVWEFARQNSETAFAEIVRRHINLVYSVALRFTGNAGDAQDVTQAVFIILARKAVGLSPRTVLTGWLYETTRFTAIRLLRTQARRRAHEQEASMQSKLSEPDSEVMWRQIAPHLEAAMSRLGERDRTLLALRYYENKTGAEAAAVLGIREEAARKRINRALEKLRRFFFQRGVTSTTTAIAESISANSIQAAPTALAKTVTTLALAKGTAASTSTLTLIKGALKIMAWTKAKTAIVAGAVLLIVSGTTVVTVKEIQKPRTYSWEVPNFNFQALEQAPPQVAILPAKYPSSVGGWGQEYAGIMGLNQPAIVAIKRAYGDSPRTLFSANLSTGLPRDSYDFIAHLGRDDNKALQQEVEREFGVVSKREMRETDVLLLEVKSPDAPALKRSTGRPGGAGGGRGHFGGVNIPLSMLVDTVEGELQIPILDRTGLAGEFDFDLNWDDVHGAAPHNTENLKQALVDQLGLELVPSRESIEMLVVEKAK